MVKKIKHKEMDDKEKIEQYYKTIKVIFDRINAVDTEKVPYNDSLIELYNAKLCGHGLLSSFVELTKGEHIENNINFLKRVLFLSGIIFAYENPEVFETINSATLLMENRKEIELRNYIEPLPNKQKVK